MITSWESRLGERSLGLLYGRSHVIVQLAFSAEGAWVAVGESRGIRFRFDSGVPKERTMYSGFAKAWVLDFAAMVPSLDEDDGYSNIAEKIRTKS